jgi:hypothetical protein
MAMLKKGWMIISPQAMAIFFNIFGGRGWGFQKNCHLLILNMHGSHVTIEAFEQATTFGFHMVDQLSLL